MSTNPDRLQRIDTMRGIACMLLVLYHVIGDTPQSGLRAEPGHVLRHFNDVLVYLRMPMFAFLSGMVYTLRPFEHGYGAFVRGKFRRLIVPMLIVGTLFFWVQKFTPGTNADPGFWKTMHLTPVAHFWFLESMFWIFALVALLDGRRWLARPGAALAAFGIACVVQFLEIGTDWLGISGTLYLLPYFLCGLFVQRFGVGRVGLVAAAAALAVALAWVCWALLSAAPLPARISVAALAIGVASCLLMNASGWRVAWLARVGAYSFGIYMFHVFFTAGCRIVLTRAGVGDLAVLAAAGFGAGVLGPILLEKAIRRVAPAAWAWIYGVRLKSR